MTAIDSHHSGHEGGTHGSVRAYVVGFALSLVLTALSFGVVMSGVVPSSMILRAISVFAVAQLLVQLAFFLHLGAAREQRSNTMIFIFTVLLIATVVAGSLWVMHNSNTNMMPGTMSIDAARTKE